MRNGGGCEHIYVVVGYLKEQFAFLPKKYKNLSLIENPDYMTVNNISSIKAAAEVMKGKDCFICEADLYVSDPSIFEADLNHSCFYGKMVKGHSDDWVLDQDENGIITRIGKYGDNCYNECGISYFKACDASIIADAVCEAYKHPGTFENLFWDEIANMQLKNLNLTVHPVNCDQIVEIDSVAELEAVDPDYIKYNQNAEKNEMNETVRDIQEISLGILKETIKVFDKHQLKYCVIYGTLLGAIRHKGFIPWDDDLDIVMPRDDFEKFKLIANDELPEHLFFQDYSTDKNYPALTAKVRDSNTTMVENGYRNIKNMNHGIFIDIFVADWYKPSFINKIRLFRNRIYRGIVINQNTYPVKKLKKKLCICFNRDKLMSRVDRTLSNMDKKGTHTCYLCESDVLSKDFFEDAIDVEFEDILVKAPKNYDKVLKQSYGDYMTFPPEEERRPVHSTELISCKEPYKSFIEKHMN